MSKTVKEFKFLYKAKEDYSGVDKIKLINFYKEKSSQNPKANIFWGLYENKDGDLLEVEFFSMVYNGKIKLIYPLKPGIYSKKTFNNGAFDQDKQSFEKLQQAYKDTLDSEN